MDVSSGEPSHVPVLLDRVVALVAPALRQPDRDRTLLVDADTAALRSTPAGLGAVRRETIAARYRGTPVETVALPGVAALAGRLGRWIGGGQ